MRDLRNLKVWQKAHELTLVVYRETRGFPRNELYGLTSQLRRGASSIPANIAEGCGRSTDRDFARFLDIAAGSGSELEYPLLLSRDLGLLERPAYEDIHGRATEVKRMLTGLSQRLRADRLSRPRCG